LSAREYSLYSGEKNEYLEILVKEVLDGMISPKLAKLREGDYVEVDNPVGSFSLNEDLPKDKKHIFIGTGTGIAPYSSFVKTHYLKNYIVIHGVKTVEEAYGIDVFDRRKYIICTSQNESGDFNGRVTNFIKQKPYEKDASYYLCGNSNMIHEMLGILDEQGINRGNIFTEVYF
jgi:ferredoxin--NADP+ reductase